MCIYIYSVYIYIYRISIYSDQLSTFQLRSEKVRFARSPGVLPAKKQLCTLLGLTVSNIHVLDTQSPSNNIDQLGSSSQRFGYIDVLSILSIAKRKHNLNHLRPSQPLKKTLRISDHVLPSSPVHHGSMDPGAPQPHLRTLDVSRLGAGINDAVVTDLPLLPQTAKRPSSEMLQPLLQMFTTY